MQTFHSFKEMGAALGVKPKEKPKKEPKEVKCRKCGAIMEHVEGTNIMACKGVITKEDGSTEPCNNFTYCNLD